MASNEIEVRDAAQTTEARDVWTVRREVNRRRFLGALGIAGAAAGAGLVAGCTTNNVTSTTGPGSGGGTSQAQVDALNFALNLKYLAATFYSFVTKGADLSSSLTAGSGAVTGAPTAAVIFTGANAAQISDMLAEITYDEVNHLTALRNILGSAVVTRPAINLSAFGAITATNALSIARALEDLQVTAYAAVTALEISSTSTVMAQVMGADSFHAGALRLVSLENPAIAANITMDSLDVPVFDPGSAAAAAKGPGASGGFFATAGASAASTAYPAGMAFTRTASQALAVLYGGVGSTASSGTKSGGFFPSGGNGTIVSV